MSEPTSARPAICLNMIVKNEAHIVGEVLDATAPYISSWVIVDTGSDDGTQDLIRNHMDRLGIPGELHERPWRDFGHNRTEALALAQGHGDYIWVMDADDTIAGTLDLTGLSADVYFMRFAGDPSIAWRAQLFRDGLPVRYVGVIHEYAACDEPHVAERLEGEYHLKSRRLGARNADPQQKLAEDLELLLAAVESNPEDTHSILQLAQNYFDMGDFVNARKWYARRAEMGNYQEEVYLSLYQIAVVTSNLGEPWDYVQDALLKAWECRPVRAEPLYAIALGYRNEQRYRLGYQFARLAAEIPFPEQDIIYVPADIYAWRASEEQAICAAAIGKHSEAFTLCRQLLARPDIPDVDRQRIASNRDGLVSKMIDAASTYPDEVVQRLLAGSGDAEVVVSLVAGPDRESTEKTLNSFLNCCTDVARVGRFLVVDAGLSAIERAVLQECYGFLEFADPGPLEGVHGPGAQLAQIRAQIDAQFWLHLGEGWRFFAPEKFITRLTAVLAAEPEVFQVGINFTDAVQPADACAPEETVRRAPNAGRYLLTDVVASGPAMFDTTRLDQAGDVQDTDADPITELGQRATAAGLRTASLDEVLCVAAI